MGKKLYVGSLPYDTTEDQIHAMFSAVGPVAKTQLMLDRDTGQSRGFGFVEMETEEAAQAAIQKLNGSPIGTRTLVVNEAKPQEKRGGGGGGGYGRGGGGGGGSRRGGGGGGYGRY